MSHLGFLLIGLGAGAAYAALSMALVMTYRSSGVINFATGAIAVYATYIYAFARKGQFTPMIPGLPKTVDFGCERLTPDAPCTPAMMMSFWPALLFALVMAALLGLVLYLLVFRPLRTAPPLARVVASIGVQVGIVVLITKQMGTVQVPVANIFPDGQFTVGETIANWRFIWTAIAIVVVAVALSALYHYTRFGLATPRCSGEREGRGGEPYPGLARGCLQLDALLGGRRARWHPCRTPDLRRAAGVRLLRRSRARRRGRRPIRQHRHCGRRGAGDRHARVRGEISVRRPVLVPGERGTGTRLPPRDSRRAAAHAANRCPSGVR